MKLYNFTEMECDNPEAEQRRSVVAIANHLRFERETHDLDSCSVAFLGISYSKVKILDGLGQEREVASVVVVNEILLTVLRAVRIESIATGVVGLLEIAIRGDALLDFPEFVPSIIWSK